MYFDISKINIPSFNFSKIKMPNINIYEPEFPKSWNPSSIRQNHSVLILGNGFDIDLGLQTTYKAFFENEKYWPFKKDIKYEEGSLPFFLNECLGAVGTWYDLEEALANYAGCSTNEGHIDEEQHKKTKKEFSILCNALEEYLTNQEGAFIKKMQDNHHAKRMKPSHCVLSCFLKKEIRSIYTFNYTNVRRIARQLILGFDDSYTHIHGSLDNSNIILGTGDQRDIKDDYFNFYKSASPHYESTNLVEDLNSADEVYIFGHSLGLNDHDYFSEFFKMASKSVHKPFAPGKVKVRIFTYDDKSEIAIKKQLMNLTEKHLIGLYAHCDFKILKTSNEYQDEWMFHDGVL